MVWYDSSEKTKKSTMVLICRTIDFLPRESPQVCCTIPGCELDGSCPRPEDLAPELVPPRERPPCVMVTACNGVSGRKKDETEVRKGTEGTGGRGGHRVPKV